SLMMQEPETIDKIQNQLGTHFNVVEHQIIATHMYALYGSDNQVEISKLLDLIEDKPIKNIASEIAFDAPAFEEIEQAVEDCLTIVLQKKQNNAYLEQLNQKLKLEKNPILAAKIGQEIIDLQKELKK